jgi:hypothetical protein
VRERWKIKKKKKQIVEEIFAIVVEVETIAGARRKVVRRSDSVHFEERNAAVHFKVRNRIYSNGLAE